MMSPSLYAYELATLFLEKDDIRIVSVGTTKEDHELPAESDNTLKTWSDLLKDSNIPIKASASDYMTKKLLEK